MNNKYKGILNASVSSASFGLIPLFSIPVLASGMLLPSLLVYRFCFGCLAMLAILLYNKTSMRISFGDTLRISLLSLLYAVSALALIEGYKYMPSGVATTLLFSYPVWTAILMILFCHKKLSSWIAGAIILAVGGVYFLSGFNSSGGFGSLKGLLLELFAGFNYAVYMVIFPMMKIRKMPSLKVTFYVFFFAMLMLLLYASFSTGGLQPITTSGSLINLILLGLLPTALSNVTLIMSLKQIESTMVAVLGAFEPMTAMIVGILAFGEPLSMAVVAGFILIVSSVVILIFKG